MMVVVLNRKETYCINLLIYRLSCEEERKMLKWMCRRLHCVMWLEMETSEMTWTYLSHLSNSITVGSTILLSSIGFVDD